MFKILRMLLNRPNEEDYNRHYESQYEDLPEEDGNAVRQNTEEVEFNKNNPVYDKRILKAKTGIMSRLSEDKKIDLLYKLNIEESMHERFEDMRKDEEK